MKKLLKILLVPAIIGLAVAYYMYNKPAKTSANLKPDFELTAGSLFQEFSDNEADANTKYLDKVVQVSGKIREVQKDDSGIKLVLETDDAMFGVICEIDGDNSDKDYKVGDEVKLKGFCTGLLMDVVITRCVEI